MNIGMMWFDNDPKTTLTAKILQAAEYYFEKYHQMPDVCLINSIAFEKYREKNGKDALVKGITIRHHLWIGIDDDEKNILNKKEEIPDEQESQDGGVL
jgi:hypothetical protein